MKSPGQIAYEAGSAHIMKTDPDRPEDGFEAWEQLDVRRRVYWEVIARTVIEETEGQHVTRFSDASTFDEICIKCGDTDANGPISGRCRR